MKLRSYLICILGWIWASCALAQDGPVTPDDFEALANGRTLYFVANGEFYGAEQYFENGETLWRPAGGECEAGRWYGQSGQICFVYDFDPTPICWSMFREAGKIYARASGDLPGNELELQTIDRRALHCPLPELSS